jgi:hypothetical protein
MDTIKKDTFIVKDSGKRLKFQSGMVRDIAEDKIDYSLALDGPMFKRVSVLLTNAAKHKYSKRNWMKASGQEEMDRFKESAVRHFMQWYNGENAEEDHMAATIFNLNGYEYVKEKLANDNKTT